MKAHASSLVTLSIALFLGLAGSNVASADETAIISPGTLANYSWGSDGMLGWAFIASNDIVVTKIGLYNAVGSYDANFNVIISQPGWLANSHPVGIWDAAGNLVV